MTTVAIQYFPDARDNTMRLAAQIGLAAHEMSVHRFPDEEWRLTVSPPR